MRHKIAEIYAEDAESQTPPPRPPREARVRPGGILLEVDVDVLPVVVHEAPALPAAVKGVSFAPPFTAFVSACLAKDQTARPSAEALLAHPWLTESQPHLVDISTWLKKTHEDDEDALASPPEKA